MKKINAILVVGFSLALSSCASNFPPTPQQLLTADYGKKPVNYKSIIKDFISAVLIDPESARFTDFSIPSKSWMAKFEGFMFFGTSKRYFGWLVCVDVNAKNRYGGYVGKKTNYFLMRGDEIVFYQEKSTRKIPFHGGETIECKYN